MAAVYAGRFIAGIGVGETVVVGPVYLSEISPAPIRGLCTCAFTGMVYLGIMMAYFANWGAEINMDDGFSRWVSVAYYDPTQTKGIFSTDGESNPRPYLLPCI